MVLIVSNYLHIFKTKNKGESPKKVHRSTDFSHVAISSKDVRLLEIDQGHKSDQVRFTIYAYLE